MGVVTDTLVGAMALPRPIFRLDSRRFLQKTPYLHFGCGGAIAHTENAALTI